MASYHLTVKNHSRSKNANVVALASYRSGERLWDERQMLHKNCRKNDKSEVLHCELFNSYRMNREQLWNAAEAAENRKNSVVAREVEIALPVDISNVQKVALAREFCKELAGRYRCAIDLAVHAPDADGDQRNYHAHILMTTRESGAGGLGIKWRQLNQPNGAGRIEMAELRKKFELLQNSYLERAGVQERVSCGRAAEMDIPRKYVALPFKKYQVLRREERVEEYKEVSGYEEFVRWKSRKELEIEDLAGELESAREREELEQRSENDIYYYDPVSAQIDVMAAEYEERQKEELRANGRRAIGEFKGLAEVNRRADGQTGPEDRGIRIDYYQSGEDIERLSGSIEQGSKGVRKEQERRDFIKSLTEYASLIARRLREFGEKVRRVARARKIERIKSNVKSWIKDKWIRINTVPDTGRPFWENASKIEHEKKFEKIQESAGELLKLKWELSHGEGAKSSLDLFCEERDKYLGKCEDLEKEVIKWNKKDLLLERIYEIKIGLEERSKEVVPALNEKVKEHETEVFRRERERQRALEESRRMVEQERVKLETMQRAIRFDKMDLLTHDKGAGEVKVDRRDVREIAQVLNRYVEGRMFLKKIRSGEEVGLADKLAVWDDIRVGNDKERLDKALGAIHYGVKDGLLKEDLIIKRELRNSLSRGIDRGQSRGRGMSM